MKQQQQGDVIITEISKLPTGCKEVSRKKGKLILAEGETTGHCHAIADKTATLWVLNNQLYLEVLAPVTITHDTHKTQEIPSGIYKIGIVQEYDYLTELTKQVKD